MIAVYIRTKHNMRVFWVIPFITLQTTLTQQLNGKKNDAYIMRWRANQLIFLGVDYVRC